MSASTFTLNEFRTEEMSRYVMYAVMFSALRETRLFFTDDEDGVSTSLQLGRS